MLRYRRFLGYRQARVRKLGLAGVPGRGTAGNRDHSAIGATGSGGRARREGYTGQGGRKLDLVTVLGG